MTYGTRSRYSLIEAGSTRLWVVADQNECDDPKGPGWRPGLKGQTSVKYWFFTEYPSD